MAESEPTKRCHLCKSEKPLTAFRKRGRPPNTHRRGNCRDCEQPKFQRLRDTRHTEATERGERRTCCQCLVNRPATDFPVCFKSASGLQNRCVECVASNRELKSRYGITSTEKRQGSFVDDRLATVAFRTLSLRSARRTEMLDRQSHDDTIGQAGPPDAEVWAAYIASPEWKTLRTGVIRERGAKCERCGSNEELQLHHTSYRRMGHEAPEDLLLLCELCHGREHGRPIDRVSGVVTDGYPTNRRQWGLRDVDTTPQRSVSVAEYEQEKAKEIA
jgi:hypothetical protein